MYDIYRAACVKEFEIVSEQCTKLLKKSLLVPQFLVDARSLLLAVDGALTPNR